MPWRGSSPKLLVLNTALMSATTATTFEEARADANVWGRLVESAVGAHLVNGAFDVFYWREGNREVDFVVGAGRTVTALEVTSGRRKTSLPGLAEFAKQHHPKRTLLVGGQGIPVEEFLSRPADAWL